MDGGKDAPTHVDSGKSHPDATKPSTDGGTPPTGDAGPDAAPAPDSGFPVPASWNATYTRPSDSTAASDRTSCTYKRGDMPAQTLGSSMPLDTAIPIEHVVVLMQENRSFDSYMGHLAAYEATKGITNTIESAPDTASNPGYPVGQLDGGTLGPDASATYPYTHAPQLCSFDTDHSWGAAHLQYDHGLNDGFFYTNNGVGAGESTTGIAPAQLSGARALWWYDQRDIPFHYDVYSTFAMADHYHSALLGPTWPNRMYLYSGTSFGTTSNVPPNISAYPTPETPVIIFDELAVRGVSFTWYEDTQMGEPGASPAPDIVLISSPPTKRYGRNPVAPFTQFLSDAQAGTLPSVSFIDGDNGNETPTGNDEHPPSEIEIGQQFVWQVVNAVTTSPQWKSTALFIVYDENGGIYDHVAPPAACKPDNLAPVLTDALDKSQPGEFDQYGFRVPMVVVSPYAKKSYVGHDVYSHTSITRFIEAKWKLPALTVRDANADPFTDLFDWQNPPFMTAPTFAQPTIDESAVTACTSELTATP